MSRIASPATSGPEAVMLVGRALRRSISAEDMAPYKRTNAEVRRLGVARLCMDARRSRLFAGVLVAVALPLGCDRHESSQAPGRSPTQGGLDAGSQPVIQAFTRWQDPEESAFQVLVPDGWQISGGLRRVNTDPTYQMEAKRENARFFFQNPVPVQYWVPTEYTAMTGYPEGTFAPALGFQFFVLRYHPPRRYITDILVAQLRQQHPDARIVEAVDLPEAAKAYQDPSASTTEAASATLEFTQAGTAMKAGFTVVTHCYPGPDGSAAWVARVVGAVAPEAEFRQVTQWLMIALASMRIEPAWLEAEIQGAAARGSMVRAAAENIRRLEYFIFREESSANLGIGGNWAAALGGSYWEDSNGNPLPDPGSDEDPDTRERKPRRWGEGPNGRPTTFPGDGLPPSGVTPYPRR